MSDELIEAAAEAIDPGAWKDELPIPTRDAVIAFHTRREAANKAARAAYAVLAPALLEKGVRLGLEAAAKAVHGDGYGGRDCWVECQRADIERAVDALDPAEIAKGDTHV